MTENGLDRREGPAGGWLEPRLLLAVFVLIVAQGAFVWSGLTPLLHGTLSDPDSYMRLDRVEYLWESGTWFEPRYPRINPPEGLVQHWTRPHDALLLLGALALKPVLGFEEALYWWAASTGPLLQLASLLALVWAAAPALKREMLWLLGLLFVVHPAILNPFMVGRADHHGLVSLLFILSIGLIIRVLLKPERKAYAAYAATVAALALWVSPETLPMIVLSIATLGLFWFLGDRRLAPALVVHALTLFVGIGLALLAERGLSHLGESEFDRISLAHLILFGLNLGFWLAMLLLERGTARLARLSGRLGASLLGALAIGVVLWLVEPGFFSSPLANVDELYRTVRLKHISELQPLLGASDLPDRGWGGSVTRLLLLLGIALPALPFLGFLVATRPAMERRAWIFAALNAAVFVALTLSQIRWSSYAVIILLLPYAALAGEVLAWLESRWRGAILARIGWPLAVVAFCVWFYLPAVALAGRGERPTETSSQCPLKPLAAFLSEPEGWGAAPKRLLAFVDFGPELLYRTPHSVYAIPNHRHQPGFTASYRIMTAADAGTAEALVRRNRVELVVICPGSVEAGVYDTAAPEPTFYEMLVAGDVPPFLEKVTLPTEIARSFKLFSVRSEVPEG